MKIKNKDAEEKLESLISILKHKDIIGYVAARNARKLRNSLIEYFSFRDELIKKYGTFEEKTGTYFIAPGTESRKKFDSEIATYAEIEHDVDIMKAKYEDCIDKLTGEEILAIDWMLEE